MWGDGAMIGDCLLTDVLEEIKIELHSANKSKSKNEELPEFINVHEELNMAKRRIITHLRNIGLDDSNPEW